MKQGAFNAKVFRKQRRKIMSGLAFGAPRCIVAVVGLACLFCTAYKLAAAEDSTLSTCKRDAETLAGTSGPEGVSKEAKWVDMTANAATVLANFDALTAAANVDGGYEIAVRMAEGIGKTPPSPEKRQAVDRFMAYMKDVLAKAHPGISGDQAVSLVRKMLYPFREVYPTHGVEAAIELAKTALDNPDYNVQKEAFSLLVGIVAATPGRGQELFALIEMEYAKKKEAQDYPSEAPVWVSPRAKMLRDVGFMIEWFRLTCGPVINWDFITMGVMSDEEYARLASLSREEMFGLVRRGGARGDYAFSVLLADGCSDETMDRLFGIARQSAGPSVTSIVDKLNYTLTRPFKEGTATAEDQRRFSRFMGILGQEIENSASRWMKRAAMHAIASQVAGQDLTKKGVKSGYGAEYQPTIDILIKALENDDTEIRDDALDMLRRIGINDPDRATEFLPIFLAMREKAGYDRSELEAHGSDEMVMRDKAYAYFYNLEWAIKSLERTVEDKRRAEETSTPLP